MCLRPIVCQKRIVTVIVHSKNEMYDYIFNENSTRAFVGDHKIFVEFISKYPAGRAILLEYPAI